MSKLQIPLILTFVWSNMQRMLPKVHDLLMKFGLFKKIDKFINGENMKSRKIKLLVWIIALATIGAFFPPLICWLMTEVLDHTIPAFTILTNGDWITIVSIIVPAYMGVITWEKHIAMKNNIAPKDLDETVDQIKSQKLLNTKDDQK